MPDNPCPDKVSQASGGQVNESQAEKLLAKIKSLAEQRQEASGLNIEDAMRQVAGELQANERLAGENEVRNLLLDVRSRRQVKSFVRKFKTLGEGLIAFMEGSKKTVAGGRRSVDYQAKALHGKYLGRLMAELEQADVLHDLKAGQITREIYVEMGEIREGGNPGLTGNKSAATIAKIIEGVTSDMVGRQNRAGALIDRIPGYVVRQTHDMDEIRRAGGMGTGAEVRRRSYQVWRDHTLPLLDMQRTMMGESPELFMRNVHEALFTGTHGPEVDEFETNVFSLKQDLSRKVSARRVLHFRDADAAWQYNERFGKKSLVDQVFGDIYYRSRSIAMMENFGPSAERNFSKLLRELQEEARETPDEGKQSDSLKDWRIQVLYDTLTGKIDVPVNHTMSRHANNVRAVTVMAKMGATIVSALTDKVFMNAELAHQSIGVLDRWAKQLTGMASRGPEAQRTLRLMGVAMDGIIGNTISRYTSHTTSSGIMHKLQQKMFDWNFMNWWTDAHKASAAELMSAHLGEHADLPLSEVPGQLRMILSQYDITPLQWDAIRSTAWAPGDSGSRMITPDQLSKIPDSVIDGLVAERDLKVTDANRQRLRDEMDLSLRTYFQDRIDMAVPTPGVAEKKWTTMGTQAGTPLGEAMRMIMMFKAFPITIMNKILGREVYGRGSETAGQWLLNDHKGKFHMAQLMAMTLIAGYASGAIRDALKGRSPKPLFTEDGKIDGKTLQDAAARGGGLGLMGDFLFNEYGRGYRSLAATLAGPVVGQLDPLAEIATLAKQGEADKALERTGKFGLDNTPFINLIYIRPVLDYFIFWNMQEALDPGSLRRMESVVERRGQDHWLRPSETVR